MKTLDSPAPPSAALRLLRKHPVLGFFGLAYLISWGLWLPLYCPPLAGWRVPYHHALGAFGPLLAAGLLGRGLYGPAALRALLRRMAQWRVRAGWYAVAVLLPLALAALVQLVVGPPPAGPWPGLGHSAEFPHWNALAIGLYNVLVFGYGEEVGWRGFALPELQQRYGTQRAVLLVAAGWAVWHLPLFWYRPGYLHLDAGGVAGWLLSLVMGSALLTWLFNGTHGSLLLCARCFTRPLTWLSAAWHPAPGPPACWALALRC